MSSAVMFGVSAGAGFAAAAVTAVCGAGFAFFSAGALSQAASKAAEARHKANKQRFAGGVGRFACHAVSLNVGFPSGYSRGHDKTPSPVGEEEFADS